MAAVCTVSILRISITFTSLFIQYHSVKYIITGIHIVIAEFLKKLLKYSTFAHNVLFISAVSNLILYVNQCWIFVTSRYLICLLYIYIYIQSSKNTAESKLCSLPVSLFLLTLTEKQLNAFTLPHSLPLQMVLVGLQTHSCP